MYSLSTEPSLRLRFELFSPDHALTTDAAVSGRSWINTIYLLHSRIYIIMSVYQTFEDRTSSK